MRHQPESALPDMHPKKYPHLLLILALAAANAAQAGTIRVLQANLFSWSAMDPAKQPPPIVKLSQYVNQQRHDFVTTQENEYRLTDDRYQLSPDYKLAGELQDASIFYDSTRWEPGGAPWSRIAVSADGGGERLAVFSQFRNKASGETVVIATTHLCIAWGGHADCNGGQYAAHVADSRSIGRYLSTYAAGDVPLIVTGDFNNFERNAEQSAAIEQAFAAHGLAAVKAGKDFIGPTFEASTIDFVYSRKLVVQSASLYGAAAGNPSDHAAIDVTFVSGGAAGATSQGAGPMP
ncbi:MULTISPECIES: endonuclease/exonuclease/phosphatase family protein [unclassified Duganella]|uniref:endonuclease/exonuclease/phosphatase family protein n=1 Tax=unclassified Duganella TaxID=2636909 RepID=UPI0018F3A9D0|nr:MULTISPECIES: endonuclease/exonuclease/phosphatase family protein [unclassified Duganella]